MRKKRTMILALGGAAVVIAIAALVGAGAVMAQSGGEDSPTPTPADQPSVIDRVAEKLGVEPDALEQAIRDVRNEDIAAAVARGDLTQEQADRLKEKLDAANDLPGFGFHLGGPFGSDRGPRLDGDERPGKGLGHGRGGFGFGFGLDLKEQIDALAAFLGISTEQLRTELQADGASLASVAEAHGKTRDELKTYVLDTATTMLDDAVASGALSQERADEIESRLNEHLDRIIDFEFGSFMSPFMDGSGDGPRFRFEHREERMAPERPVPERPSSGSRSDS